MTCEAVDRDDIAEQYVAHRLPEDRRAEFEDHYFNCARCLDRLNALEAIRGELARTGSLVRRRQSTLWRATGLLAAAAALVLAIRVANDWSSTRDDTASQPVSAGSSDTAPPPAATPGSASTARPDLAALGAITPPAYDPPRLRAAPTESRRAFRDAMRAYQALDYKTAILGLRRATALDPGLLEARFFLAICYLQTDQPQEAAAELQQIVGAGDSAYREDGHFFLAKALIRRGDLAGARRELRAAVAHGGERQNEARQLLEKLN